MCQVLSKTNFPCMYKKTTSTLLLCAKFYLKQISPAYQHQTFPVKVRKNYVSFFRKRCRAHYGRPSAGRLAGAARWDELSFVQNDRDYVQKFEHCNQRYCVRFPVPAVPFNFILTMCQVLYKTNFPCRYKKTTSTLLLC